ncbi:hypothetical protein [Robertkochia solimangrovi]|uniref:hypothetical protein n=1 Tax=Robertkochia solimangrovi TaxID=2213046 RepID=UPI00117D833A|nr:hypothetical protein [Robertkochia solimangrovi]
MKKIFTLLCILLLTNSCEKDETCDCRYYTEVGQYLKQPYTPQDVDDNPDKYTRAYLDKMNAECQQTCD